MGDVSPYETPGSLGGSNTPRTTKASRLQRVEKLMASNWNGTVEVAALGRPLCIGMLYDCRTDSIISGMTLWDEDDLAKHTRERRQQFNNFAIEAHGTSEDKYSVLDVGVSLRASVLFGLVKVEGSAQYLNHTKNSKNQANVTMKYKATTAVQELSMDCLGNIKHHSVFKKGIATHVITAVLYGAKAFFLFDCDVSDEENVKELQAKLKTTVNLFICSAEGRVSLKNKDTMETCSKNVSCTFYGDFCLQKTPSTFQEAIQVYKSLPELLGANGENAVPMKVWMLPLACLDPSAAKVKQQISIRFLLEVESILEHFSELEMRCNEALNSTAAQQIKQMDENLNSFKEMCSVFKEDLKQRLAEKLPLIRGGEEEESVIKEILTERLPSPLNLNQWIDFKEMEIWIFNYLTKLVKNIKIISSEIDLYGEILTAKVAVCFVFTSLGSVDPFLSALSTYKQESKPGEKGPQAHNSKREQLYDLKEVVHEMRKNAKFFSDFAEANKENKNTKFLTAVLSDETHQGSTIYLFKDGISITKNFEPPSKPETVTAADIKHNSMTLKISPPRFGAENITSYSVEYSVRGQDGWTQKTAPKSGEVTVSDLKPNTEYEFRCRAVTSAGVGPTCDVTDPIRTSPCSPPEEAHVETSLCEMSVSWKKPALFGQDVQVLGYIVEYAEAEPGLNEEDLQWKLRTSRTQNVTISRLQSNTEYAVRIMCDCGEAGRSRESLTVVCRTPDTYLLLLQEILQDFPQLETRCKNALQSTTVQQFPQIGEKLETFKVLCLEFQQAMTLKLKDHVPSVLSKEEMETVVMKMIEMRNKTGFKETNLRKWMDYKEQEIQVIQSLTEKMKNTEIIQSQYMFEEKIHSSEVLVCFIFTSLADPELLLSVLSENKDMKDEEHLPGSCTDVEPPWFIKIHDELLQKVKLFSDFAEANKENMNIKFLQAGLSDETHQGSTIYLFKDGISITKNFKPPSKPETVTAADIKHNSMTLKISPPRFGAENITSYSVEYSVRGQDGWTQKTTPRSGEVTVSDLKPNTEYEFRCRAVTSAGVGPTCDVTDPIRTSPCSPPEEAHVETSLCEMSVSWKKPALFGQDVQVLGYIVEYAEAEPGLNEEDLQWKLRTSRTQNVTISRLQSNTEYAVRIMCDCGEAGRSRESLTVVCRTPDTYLLLLQEILQDFPQLETRCKNALQSTTVQQFPQIGEKLETFKVLCLEFQQAMTLKLKDHVPSVLNKEEMETVVMKMIEMRNKTGFKETNLRKWMDYKEQEIQVIQSLTEKMKNTEIIQSQYMFEEKIHSSEVLVCFIFTSLADPELLLSVLSENKDMKDEEHLPGSCTDVEPPWFIKIHDELLQKVKLFSYFAEANKENMNIKFLQTGLSDETHQGSTIYLFKDGISITKNFEPPSKPETVTAADIKHNSMTLKISPPRFGAENITSYSVEYSVRGQDGWTQKTTPRSGEVTVSDLKPNTEYEFRCRAVTSAGVGPTCDVTDPIRTSPCSPPEEAHVETSLCEMSVSWKKPALFGQDVQVLGYIVEYAEAEPGLNEEDLQWKLRTSRTQNVTISRLQSNTEYAVRIMCDCGEAGRSRESLTVVCRTPDTYLLLLQEILQDFPQLETRCKNALQSTTVQQFPQIGEKLETFKVLCLEFQQAMTLKLKDHVPSVLNKEEMETVVMKMIEMRNKTGFKETNLRKWMDYKEQEIQVIQSLTEKMKNTEIIQSQYMFEEKIHSSEVLVCFIFTSLADPELLLSVLSENKDMKDEEHLPGSCTDVEPPWFIKIHDELLQKVKLFSYFAEANKENMNIKFLQAGLSDETHQGSTIYLFKDGISITKNFEPPSKPETVTAADIKHNSMTLKISPPRFGAENITSYSVEYSVRGQDGWTQKTTPRSGEVTVSDLKPNTEYEFRCRAVTSAGVGPTCDVTDPIRTSPCSPPEEAHVETSLCEMSVSWKKPALFGQDVQVLGYIVEYAEAEPGLNEEDLQWKLRTSRTQNVTISRLQSNTEYAVRIMCDCGEAGRSRESLTVVCRTPDTYLLLLQEILQDFPQLETRCKNALQSTTVQQFPQIGEKLETFKVLCLEFQQAMTLKLKDHVPSVLSKEEMETVVMKMIEMRNKTGFKETNLRKWMDYKEQEIQVIQSLTEKMKNTEIIQSQYMFEEKIHSSEVLVCFIFTSLADPELLLSVLSENKDMKDEEHLPGSCTDVEPPWFIKIHDELLQKVKLFRDFAEANKENMNIKFLQAGLSDETHQGSTIYLFKDGISITKNFEPPSKPETVTAADIKHNSMTLKISPPRFGAENITSYSVEYSVRGQDGWTQKTTPRSGEVTVSDLKPNTEYEFRCRAVTSAGVGPTCDVTDPIRTSPCSPPEEAHVETSLCEMSVSWKKPALFGQDVQVLGYIVEYAEAEPGLNEEDLQWKLRTSRTQNVTISRLQSNTEYAVRIMCDCGEAGRSRESLTVVCRTPDTYLLLLQEILQDFPQLETRCKNALQSTTVQQFPQIGEKLETFKVLCLEFQQAMTLKLKDHVPSVLSKEEMETVVMKMIEMRNKTGFKETNLRKWMDYKEQEIQVIQSLTEKMKNTEIIQSQYMFEEKIHSSEVLVCFIFTSLADPELLLSVLSENKDMKDEEHLPGSCTDVEPPWFIKIHDELLQKVKLFSYFAEANKENMNIKFLQTGLSDKTHQGSAIYLFKDGISITKNFEPPSKPETVTAADIKHNSVTLKISPPRFGAENITSYSVEYSVRGQDGWTQKTTPKSGEVTVSDLKPNTEYKFRCRAVTSAGVGPTCDVTDPIRTSPCSPPGQPHINTDSFKMLFTWQKPSELGQDVQVLGYIVEYAEAEPGLNEEDLQWKQVVTTKEKVIISGLQSDTEYVVRVSCDCGEAGRSRESLTVHVCTTKYIPELLRRVSEKMTSACPSVYQLPLAEEDMHMDGCRWFHLGKESRKRNRTIILFGAAGSGKSTLINGMINYIVGVEWKDDFRFTLTHEDQLTSQSHSQTSDITVYRIHHQEGFRIDYSLTIIDSPELGGTPGIERDKLTTEHLCSLLSHQHAVDEVDVLCFVAPAASRRLTQKYVFESMLSIFGEDVAENIRILVTSADDQQPPVLEVINGFGVQCPKAEDGLPVHFKFNNSALFATNNSSKTDNTDGGDDDGDDDGVFHQMIWNMGTISMKKFFVSLDDMDTRSLTPTKSRIRERKQLEKSVEALQEQIKAGLAQMEEIKETRRRLRAIFEIFPIEYEMTIMKPKKQDHSDGGNFINCQRCHMTCQTSRSFHLHIFFRHRTRLLSRYRHRNRLLFRYHHRTRLFQKEDGFCISCPGRCHFSVHFVQKYRWEYEEEKVKFTVWDLIGKYPRFSEGLLHPRRLMEGLQEVHHKVKDEVKNLLENSHEYLNSLQNMPWSLQHYQEYIFMISEGEECEAKPGWRKRQKCLMKHLLEEEPPSRLLSDSDSD